MKRFVITAAALLCLALSGCKLGNEPNDMAYVTALGIDKADTEGVYDITIQFAKPSQISGGASEEGGKSEGLIEHLTVEAPTVHAGVALANKIISKTFSLEHLSIVIMSQDIAYDNAADLVKKIVGDKNIRLETFVAVAPEGARKFLAGIEPVIEINPAKYYRMILRGNAAKSITSRDIHSFYLNIISECADTIIPVAGIMEEKQQPQTEGAQTGQTEKSAGGTQNSQSEESGGKEDSGANGVNLKQEGAKENFEVFEWGMKDYTAGEIAISETNKSELAGGAVFSGGQLKGYIGTNEVKALSMMTDQRGYSIVTFDTGREPLTIYIVSKHRTKVRVDTSGDNPRIDIELDLSGSLPYVPEDFLSGENVEDFERRVSGSVKDKCEKSLYEVRDMGCDALGAGYYAARKFTIQEFKEYNWREKYKNAEFNVDVKFELDNMGV